MHSTTCSGGGSHDAFLCHCLDEDGDGRGYGLEGLECLNSASHQTVLTLWREGEERGQDRGRGREGKGAQLVQ